MPPIEQLDLVLTTAKPLRMDIGRQEPVSAPSVKKEVSSWRLEWQKRGGRAGEDWVVRVGVMVAGDDGVVMPLHKFLQGVLRDFCLQLSIGQTLGGTACIRDARAVELMVQATIKHAEEVQAHPVEMPDNYAATCTVAMLWGNFLDTLLAIFDSATSINPRTLCVDATTLAVVAPSNYSTKKAQIPDAAPCTDFYAVSGPDREDRGWQTWTEEGVLSPRAVWALMNALNCQFNGPAWQGKDLMREWFQKTTRKFLSPIYAEGITNEEMMGLGAAAA